MSVLVHLDVTGQPILVRELEVGLKLAGLDTVTPGRMLPADVPVEIIVTLGSAGAFTALHHVLASVLRKDSARELTIAVPSTGARITVKGHNLKDEKELLRAVGSDLFEPRAGAQHPVQPKKRQKVR